MTTISSSIQAYTPPVTATAPAIPATPATPVDSNQTDTTNQAPAISTNADTNAPAVYNAVASASAPIIRGANINTTA